MGLLDIFKKKKLPDDKKEELPCFIIPSSDKQTGNTVKIIDVAETARINFPI